MGRDDTVRLHDAAHATTAQAVHGLTAEVTNPPHGMPVRTISIAGLLSDRLHTASQRCEPREIDRGGYRDRGGPARAAARDKERLMEITRNTLTSDPGPSDWFTGTVFIDTIAAAPPLGAAAVHFP